MITKPERLQKVLAQAGIASRREIETWIAEGRIKVNGVAAKLGDKVSQADRIYVDGRRFVWPKPQSFTTQVIVYHKPVGEICSRKDPEGRPTIYTQLPKIRSGRWVSVGRLDLNTSGLLLFTNNGELAHRLMKPNYEIEREYAVRVVGEVSQEVIQRLQEGVMLPDGPGRFKKILFAGGEGVNRWYHVVITEGRQREVRRLWESQDIMVSRLIRIRYGNVELGRRIRAGRWEALAEKQIQQLANLVGLSLN